MTIDGQLMLLYGGGTKAKSEMLCAWAIAAARRGHWEEMRAAADATRPHQAYYVPLAVHAVRSAYFSARTDFACDAVIEAQLAGDDASAQANIVRHWISADEIVSATFTHNVY